MSAPTGLLTNTTRRCWTRSRSCTPAPIPYQPISSRAPSSRSHSTRCTPIAASQVDSDTVRIDGWSAPGGGTQVELRLQTETRTTVADEDGRFVFDGVPHGMAQFLLRPPDGTPVITPSLQL